MQKFFAPKGQALLTLLFFVIIGLTVTTAAVIMIIVNSLSGAKFQQGTVAYEVAQSGIDNAMLRLLRNPSYTGENLSVGDGTAYVTVTGNGTTYTITSEGKVGNLSRKIQVNASYVNNVFTITTQKELF